MWQKLKIKWQNFKANTDLRAVLVRSGCVIILIALVFGASFAGKQHSANLAEQQRILAAQNLPQPSFNDGGSSEQGFTQPPERGQKAQPNKAGEGSAEGAPNDLAAMGGTKSLQIPANGKWARPFGYGYDATWDEYRFHQGQDMTLEIGASVVAADAGKITEISQDDLWGSSITIEHADGIKTVYRGLTPAAGLLATQQVAAGGVIGQITAPALAEEEQGSHLHFEIWQNDEAQDPAGYVW